MLFNIPTNAPWPNHRPSVWLDVSRVAPSAQVMDSAWTTNVYAILASQGHSVVHLSATLHQMSVPSLEPYSVLLSVSVHTVLGLAIDRYSLYVVVPGSMLGTLALCYLLCLFILILIAVIFISRRSGRGYSRCLSLSPCVRSCSPLWSSSLLNCRLYKMWLVDWKDLEVDQQVGAGTDGAVYHPHLAAPHSCPLPPSKKEKI